jgi:hypothetical protein
MKIILTALFFFSCSPARVQLGTDVSSSEIAGENNSSGTSTNGTDEFSIYLLPESVSFGPNPVPGKNYYLGSGQVSTVNGTLSGPTLKELLINACGTSCSVEGLLPISGNPNLWSYQLSIPSVEEFTLTIPEGISSYEELSVKTKNSTSSKFVYAGVNNTESPLFYSFIRDEGPIGLTPSSIHLRFRTTHPLVTANSLVTANLLDLQNLTLPPGCEGLTFSETIYGITNSQVLSANFIPSLRYQTCVLVIPENTIKGISNNQNYINKSARLVMGFNINGTAQAFIDYSENTTLDVNLNAPTTEITLNGSIISINDNDKGATCPFTEGTYIKGIFSNRSIFGYNLPEAMTTFNLCGLRIVNIDILGKGALVEVIRSVRNCNGVGYSSIKVNLTASWSDEKIDSVNGILCDANSPPMVIGTGQLRLLKV